MGERIGYIGLGKMGLALSKVLLEDGHEVCGYDVDEERKKMLADAGGRPLDSGREVAENADIVCSILLKPEHIEENAFGENGVDLQIVKAGREMFQRALDAGWGKDDAARVIEVYEGKDRG